MRLHAPGIGPALLAPWAGVGFFSLLPWRGEGSGKPEPARVPWCIVGRGLALLCPDLPRRWQSQKKKEEKGC